MSGPSKLAQDAAAQARYCAGMARSNSSWSRRYAAQWAQTARDVTYQAQAYAEQAREYAKQARKEGWKP